jgi:putative NADH-flavin reductase
MDYRTMVRDRGDITQEASLMKVTIFGATGGTGSCLVEQALAAGHEVTAVVRDPVRLRTPDNALLHAAKADVLDPESIAPLVADADAVLTAIGPRGSGPTTICHDSVASIIKAMHKAGSRRLIMVSGSIVTDKGESPYMSYLVKPIVRATFLRHVCTDMRSAEDAVHASDLDWTIMRPPSLSDKPANGHYRKAIDRNLPHGFTVSRADLAACMLALAADPAAVHRHVAIAS